MEGTGHLMRNDQQQQATERKAKHKTHGKCESRSNCHSKGNEHTQIEVLRPPIKGKKNATGIARSLVIQIQIQTREVKQRWRSGWNSKRKSASKSGRSRSNEMFRSKAKNVKTKQASVKPALEKRKIDRSRYETHSENRKDEEEPLREDGGPPFFNFQRREEGVVWWRKPKSKPTRPTDLQGTEAKGTGATLPVGADVARSTEEMGKHQIRRKAKKKETGPKQQGMRTNAEVERREGRMEPGWERHPSTDAVGGENEMEGASHGRERRNGKRREWPAWQLRAEGTRSW
jgi:hypothetical protein